MIGDAAPCALAGQTTPGVCGTCMDDRGVKAEMLTEGACRCGSIREIQAFCVALLLVCLGVIERESLQWLAGQAELSGLLRRAIVVPLVDQNSFDHPHCRGAVSTGAMNKRRLSARFRDCLDKGIGDRGVRCISVEWEVHEVDAGSLGCRRFTVDVGSLFVCQPQIDDGCEPHLLDPGHRSRCYRTGTRHGCLHLSEVGDP